MKGTLYFPIWLAVVLCPLSGRAQFVTKGDAIQVSSKCYQVTEDKLKRFGIIWWKDKVDLSQKVDFNFILYLGSKNDNGADGIAFLFHNDPRGFDAKGAVAGGLGFGYSVEEPTAKVIKPSVAIEFDTYNNPDQNGGKYGDVPFDHTTVVYNGDVGQPKFPPIWINPDNPDVENNTCHDYRITWDPGTKELKLYFDGNLRFTHQDDIVNTVFGGATQVYYGFTGSTGGLSNEQTVCLDLKDSKPEPQNDVATTDPSTAVTVKVMDNDTHSTGEGITLTRIASGPANGVAQMVGQQIVYTPKPGFIGTDTFTYEICEAEAAKCYAKCATATVTVTVACSVLPPTVNTGGATDLCPGTSVKLTALSAGSVPAGGSGNMFVWSNGQQGPSITVNQAGSYSVKEIAPNGCEASSAVTKVTEVSALQSPVISVVGPTTVCGSGSVTLSVPVQAGVTVYQWKRDGSPVGQSLSTFTATLPGVYSVELTGACGTVPASNTVTFTVNPSPGPVSTVSNGPTTFCSGGSVTLTAVAGGNLPQSADPGYTYEWSNGQAGPSITVAQSGAYSVKMKTAAGCESSSPETQVTVLPAVEAPTITASGPIPLCPGGSVTLTAVLGGNPSQSAGQGATFVWSTGAVGPSVTVTKAGAYSVKVKTAAGCESPAAETNVTIQRVVAKPAVTDGGRCGLGSVNLKASGGPEGSYRWYDSPTAATPLTGATGSTFATPSLKASATYYVSLLQNGCESDRVPVQAEVYPAIVASTGPDHTITYGESIILEAAGGDSYQWQPAQGLSNPNSANPVAWPTETTTYTVKVTGAGGCSAEAQVTVTVRRELNIPTAFSPNGDGVNETWEIANMPSFPEARVEIFNRWGNRIFDTSGYRNDWSGTYQGSPLPIGTYFYVITLGRGQKLTGPVSIVR